MVESFIRPSRHTFTKTVALLRAAIAASGATLFAELDQSAAAASVGLVLRPTTLLLFGNPKAGTLLMEAFPAIALELPLKLAIWETDGAVSVAYTPARSVGAAYGVTGKDSILQAMDSALSAISESVS
jgi:uncharacterized protein (DUF302 family)